MTLGNIPTSPWLENNTMYRLKKEKQNSMLQQFSYVTELCFNYGLVSKSFLVCVRAWC